MQVYLPIQPCLFPSALRFVSSSCRRGSHDVVSTVNPPAHLSRQREQAEVARTAYRRNSFTSGVHTTFPGWGMPSSGGLHEYWVISRREHCVRSTGGLRRFSWKLLWLMVLTWSGRESTGNLGTRGAILYVQFGCPVLRGCSVERGGWLIQIRIFSVGRCFPSALHYTVHCTKHKQTTSQCRDNGAGMTPQCLSQ